MKNQFLCSTTARKCCYLIFQFFFTHQIMFSIIYLHRISKSTGSTWYNRNFVYRCRFCLFSCYQSVSDFMIRYDQFFFIRKNTVFLLISGNYNFNTFFKICLCGKFTSITYCTKRRFIDNIGKFSSGSAGSSLRYIIKTNGICNLDFLCMYLQNLLTALKIRKFYRNSSVKTSRTKKCRVKRIRTVCCRKNYHAFGSIKAIHFCKELIQSLFTFIIATCKSSSITFLTNCINLINKYNTWCFFICLFKKITYFGRAHTNKHFYKLRSRNREKRNFSFTCNCLGKKSLTCSRRTHKQCTLWHRRPNFCILLRIMQIINDLRQKIFCLIFTCNIRKFNSCRRFHVYLGITFAKRHCTTRAATHR